MIEIIKKEDLSIRLAQLKNIRCVRYTWRNLVN